MDTSEAYRLLRESAAHTIAGQEEVLEQMAIALFTGGHVLLEGVPGTAKTLMAKTVARAMRAQFKRVQFTPDLMPSDLIGSNIFNLATTEFTFRQGPVFTNILLADEINRSPAKTQAALLEAMEERQVTMDGRRYPLPALFFVLATQNPIEYEGTYPLPEAQLDRFLMKVVVRYPSAETEMEILRRYHAGFDAGNAPEDLVPPVLDEAGLAGCRAQIAAVRLEEGVLRYVVEIATESRRSPDVLLGASPRASIALLRTSKTLAAIRGRDYVLPDDVKALAYPVLRHRLLLRPEAEIEGVNADAAITRILGAVAVPR